MGMEKISWGLGNGVKVGIEVGMWGRSRVESLGWGLRIGYR